MIKLVLSDVDGTLIPLGNAHVSVKTMQAIHAALDSDVHFGLATGRDVVELRQLFQGDNSAFQTGVLSNGKKIYLDGELVQLTLIDHAGLCRMEELVREYPGVMMTIYPFKTDASNPIFCTGITEDELQPWAKRYSFKGTIVDHLPDVEAIGATLAYKDPKVLEDLEARASALCPEFDLARPAATWWDILPKGLNKGSALQILMQTMGIDASEVVMFGDADNDLAILNSVENAVVVSGATPAALAASTWQIGACEDDAVAEALLDIVEASRAGQLPSFMSA